MATPADPTTERRPESPPPADTAADALPEEAARALRRLLKTRGVSQRELSRTLGVTEATVSRWLSRQQGVGFSMLQRVCDTLEVPLSAILVPDAPPEGDPVGLVRRLTDLTQRRDDRLDERLDVWTAWLEQATAWRDETAAKLRQIEQAQERLRTALHRVPLYQQNHRGDPRLGEGDPNAALAVAYAQLPPGATARTVGPRGFALLVNNAVVADLGVRRGDVVFVNPDAAYTAGALVAVGAEWPEGPEGPPPPRGQPKAITLRVLAYGEGPHRGALVARTALEPATARGPDLAPEAFTVYGPVVLHQALTFLPEGRGHPRVLRRERPQHPPADGAEGGEPGVPVAPPAGAPPDDPRHWTIGPDGRPISFLDDRPPPLPPPNGR